MINFKALEIMESPKGCFSGEIVNKTLDTIAEKHILIKVEYSSLNYKDCLSIAGHKGVTRNYPHIPGIDCAGEVVDTKSSEFNRGDKVIVTGYDFGMNSQGGFAEYVEVPQEWVVKLPKKLSCRKAMMFGTAGFTAMSAILSLEDHFAHSNKQRNILVTGATGGVGSISCLLLKEYNYRIVASTRNINNPYLSNLSIDQIINSELLVTEHDKLLLEKLYEGVIDNLGGEILGNIIKHIAHDGIVISCGNAVGLGFQTTVFPFILRAVTLKGISSANTKMNKRYTIWNKIAEFKNWHLLENIITEISLDKIMDKSQEILAGNHHGRFLIKIV